MRKSISLLFLTVLLVSQLTVFQFIPLVKTQETQQNVFGNPSLPSWKNITVTVAGDGKSFTVDNTDNLTWTFRYGANKYPSIYQSGVQIVKDELWMLQVYDGSWKDVGSSVNVFYEQVTSYNVRVTQAYTSANGDYNVTWDFYGGYRPKISLSANIVVAGNYRIDWRTYVYKDYAVNMTNYVKFWDGVEEAVVFDYSDVYEAFGNITSVEGVEGWVKGKRFDLIFNVGSLSVGFFSLDPNFGYETAGTSVAALGNKIRGSVFLCTEAGTANSITAYLSRNLETQSINAKCAIYDHDTLALVGYTEQKAITTKQWYSFSITSGGALTANHNYVLVAWSNQVWDDLFGSYDYAKLYWDAGDANQGHYQSKNYNSFPDPLVPTHDNNKYSIYCTYSTGGVAYTVNLTETVTTAWNVLTKWNAIADLSQPISSAWNVLIQSTFNTISSLSIATSLVIAIISTFSFGLSQVITTSWSVLTQWNAILGLNQALSTTWQILIQTSFNIATTLTNTFTWSVEVIHTTGGILYIVDLSQAISTSWNVLTRWNAIASLSQSLSTVWNVLIQWTSNVGLTQSLSTAWTILTQTSYNAIMSLSNTFTWTVDVLKYVAHLYTVDLSLTIVTSWIVNTIHTWIDWSMVAIGLAMVAFIIAAAAIALR